MQSVNRLIYLMIVNDHVMSCNNYCKYLMMISHLIFQVILLVPDKNSSNHSIQHVHTVSRQAICDIVWNVLNSIIRYYLSSVNVMWKSKRCDVGENVSGREIERDKQIQVALSKSIHFSKFNLNSVLIQNMVDNPARIHLDG